MSVTAGGGDELEDEPDPSPLILSSAASKPTASSPPTEGEQGANNEDKEENQKNNVWARFIDIEVRSSISDLEGCVRACVRLLVLNVCLFSSLFSIRSVVLSGVSSQIEQTRAVVCVCVCGVAMCSLLCHHCAGRACACAFLCRLELEPFVVDVYCPDTQQEWPFTVLVVTKAPLSSRGAHAVETASKDTGSARDAAAAASESKSKDSKKPDKTLQLTPKILENDIILKVSDDPGGGCGGVVGTVPICVSD